MINRYNQDKEHYPIETLENYLNHGCTALAFKITEKKSTKNFFCEGSLEQITNIPLLPTSLFDIASVSKLYTTALILKLFEKGELDLQSPISSFLKNFRNSSITIEDLLTHHVQFNLFLSEYRTKHPNDFKESLLNITPPNTHSDEINYHNLGYLYLGFIIEEITKKTLQKNFEELFQSLNLCNTITGATSKKTNTVTSELINGIPLQGQTHDESASLLGGIAGNAGIFTNADDLLQFGQAWIEEKIVNKTILKKVFANYDRTNNSPQGLGWWGRIPGQQTYQSGIFCHPGFTGCLLAINPSKEKVGAFLSNRTYSGRDNKKHQEYFIKFIEQLL